MWCRNLNLRFATKAIGVARLRANGSSLESVKVDSFTLFALSRTCDVIELESQMDSQRFKERFQGSKLNGLSCFLYH
jgi:hypothetical protein